MEYYRIPLYIIFGVLPSLVWLFYYLKKDLHPEPKKMIVKVFLYGSLVAILVFPIQIFLSELLKKIQNLVFFANYPIAVEILKWFVVIALTEELSKYLAVKLTVFGRKEIDEPVDIMIYMVVAALGFSAVENIFYLLSPIDVISFNGVLQATITISFIRFIGGTFLHTLCSALVGYFIALSCTSQKRNSALIMSGIFLAALLHGFYNFSIIALEVPLSFGVPILIITGLAAFSVFSFKNAKRMKSVCKI